MAKKLLKLVLPAAIVGGAACFLGYTVLEQTPETTKTASLTETVNNITFEEAKKDESKRQAYIDQLIAQHGKPHYLVEVVYEPNKITSLENEKNEVYRKLNVISAMATGAIEGTFKDFGKRKIRARTRISEIAFNNSEESFMMGLFSHERTVARCIYEGFSTVPTDTPWFYEGNKEKCSNNILTLLIELEASSNSIDFCRKNRLSEKVTNDCISDYKMYYHALATGFPDVPEELRKKIDVALNAYKRDYLK